MDEVGILTVCTGNVCRSPLLERLLQRTLDERYGSAGLPVRSAGTAALEGSPMDERAAAVLRGLDGDPTSFRARHLTEPMVRSAVLVLTATREHRAMVSRMHPRAMKRTFTFRELAHILRHVEGEQLSKTDDLRERLEMLGELGTARRGLHRLADQHELDIVDPYRRADDVYLTMREQVVAAYPVLERALVG